MSNFFSQEYLEQLQLEHKFIVASINRLKNKNAFYMHNSSAVIMDDVFRNLLGKKLELEVKIDELVEFLN